MMKLQDLHESKSPDDILYGFWRHIGADMGPPPGKTIDIHDVIKYARPWMMEEWGGGEGVYELLRKLQDDEGLIIFDPSTGSVQYNMENKQNIGQARQHKAMSAAAARDPNFTRGT